MTTDPTPLQERIEHELEAMFDGGGFNARDMARDLTPIIAAEARKAQADIWDEGFQAGWTEHADPGPFVNDLWDAKTPNPYRVKED